MPQIRSVNNGGIATVSDELAEKMIATGLWKIPEEAPPAKKTTRKRATKPAPAPVEDAPSESEE